MEQSTHGTEHPLELILSQAVTLFTGMGFSFVMGPELETEWYNFDALNVPKDHPARDMQDTFYIKNAPGKVLRTHATNATSRALEKLAQAGKSEGAYVSIGKVYRNEATDATHEMQFYQIDGMMIGESVTIANLKAVLLNFYKGVLGEDVDIRFRPSFFPFVEPGLEVWVEFRGKWLEVMGAGMIHPNVLKNAGLDPQKVQGFAFGGGLDRIAMVKWNIGDVRLLYQGDLRINQF